MDISPDCKLLLLLYEADAEPPCGFQFLLPSFVFVCFAIRSYQNCMQCPSKFMFDGPVLLKDYQSYSLKILKIYVNETRFTIILS